MPAPAPRAAAVVPAPSAARLPRAVGWLALFALAAGYLRLGVGRSLEWVDEGMIVYPMWRTAEGDLPYVAFGHLYGPSLFFLNGALLRLFGPDLAVVRALLLGVKALVALEVYLLARLVVPRSLALLAWAAAVVILGSPLWLFNTPYATYYATAACLGGLLALATERTGGAWRPLLAGLAFGTAATFKQTQGLLAWLALAPVVFSWSRAGGRPVRSAALLPALGTVRLLSVPAVVALGVAVMAQRLGAPSVWLLLAPAMLVAAAWARRQLAAWPPGDEVVHDAGRVVALGLGAAVPLLGYAAYYAARGRLDALVFHTVAGLPQRFDCFLPLAAPSLQSLLSGAVVASTFALAWTTFRRARAARRTAALALLAAAVALGVLAGRGAGLRTYLGAGWWTYEGFLLAPLLPFAACAAGVFALRREAGHGAQPGALLTAFAAASLPLLYPWGDIPHVLMVLPLFLPLAALGLAPFLSAAAAAGRWQAALALALAWGWSAAFAFPFVEPYRPSRRPEPAAVTTFPRASGIAVEGPEAADAAALLRHVAGAPVFVVPNEQMIYFLAGARSPLQREEFLLYAVAADLLSPERARPLVDEDAMIRALADARPLIVDRAGSAPSRRIAAAFPRLAAHLATGYGSPVSVGRYQVRAPLPAAAP